MRRSERHSLAQMGPDPADDKVLLSHRKQQRNPASSRTTTALATVLCSSGPAVRSEWIVLVNCDGLVQDADDDDDEKE